jgi:hypothetical protein
MPEPERERCRMAKRTNSDAARVTGVSRMLLYRYIKAGKLSRAPDGLIDTAEILRASLMLQTSDVTTPVTMLHDVTATRRAGRSLCHRSVGFASVSP